MKRESRSCAMVLTIWNRHHVVIPVQSIQVLNLSMLVNSGAESRSINFLCFSHYSTLTCCVTLYVFVRCTTTAKECERRSVLVRSNLLRCQEGRKKD